MDNLSDFHIIMQQLGNIPAALVVGNTDQVQHQLLAKFPWSVVYSFSSDPEFSSYFNIKGTRQVIDLGIPQQPDLATQKERAKPDKRNLPIVNLDKAPLDMLPHTRQAIMKAMLATIVNVLNAHGVIFLYEIPQPLYEALNDILINYPRQKLVYVFGAREDNFASEWEREGKAVLFSQSFLELYEESELDESNFETHDSEKCSYFFVKGTQRRIRETYLFNINAFAQLLTSESVGELPLLSTQNIPLFFKIFLDKSTVGFPNWYCYDDTIGFHLRRSFDSVVYDAVINALKDADDTCEAGPVLLSGAACSGKTNSLNYLAYRIYCEKTYPVIYIPNIGMPQDIKKDLLDPLNVVIAEMEEVSKDSKVPILIVWDTACMQVNELRNVLKLRKGLRNYGRQVQVVCTSYDPLQNGDDASIFKLFTTIQVPQQLTTDKEKKELLNMLTTKAGLEPEFASAYLDKNVNNPDLVATLYLFSEFHTILQKHLRRESDSRNINIQSLVANMIEEAHKRSAWNSLNTMFPEVWARFSPGQDSNEPQEAFLNELKKDFRDDLHRIVTCVAFCTYYNNQPIPSQLIFRLIRVDNAVEPWRIYSILSNHSLLRECESAERGNYGLRMRSHLEAQIWLDHEEHSANHSRMAIFLDILRVADFCNRDEVWLLQNLIQAIGPNCKISPPSSYTLWNKHRGEFPMVWQELGAKRMQLQSTKLFPLELNLIREWYKGKPANEKVQALQEALRNAERAIAQLPQPKEMSAWDVNLLNEYCLANLEVIEAKNETVRFNQLYNSVAIQLFQVGELHDNSYVRVTLLKLVCKSYDITQNENLLIKLVDYCMRYRTVVTVQRLGRQEDDIELMRWVAEAESRIDKFEMSEERFQKSVESGEAYGIIVRLYQGLLLSSNQRISFSEKPDLMTQKQGKWLLEQYLENPKYSEIVWGNPTCMYYWIHLKWMNLSKHAIIPRTEDTRVALMIHQWEDLYKLCSHFLIISGEFGEDQIEFLRVVCASNLPDYYSQCDKMCQTLRNHAGTFAASKGKRWYLLCDEKGNPRTYQGRVENYRSDRGSGHLLLAKEGQLYGKVYFRATDIGMANVNDGMLLPTPVCISISYSGLQAVKTSMRSE